MQKQLVSATIVYTLLTFLQPFLAMFVLQPFYLHYFDSESYAIISIMSNYTGLIQLLSAVNIAGTFFTFYYNYHHNQQRLQQFLGQVLSFTAWSTVLFGLGMYFLGPSIFQFVFKSDSLVFHPYGWIATLAGIGYTFYVPYIIFLRNQKKLFRYALLMLLIVTTGILGQIILVAFFDIGIEGALIGKAIGNWAGAIFALWFLYKHMSWKIDWKYFVRPFEFLKYLLPDSLLNWVYAFGDRFILERLATLTVVATYSLLNTLAGAIEMAYFAIRSAMLPFFYEALEKEENSVQELKNLHLFYVSLLVLAISGIIWLTSNLHWVVAKENYLIVRTYVFIYALGYLFSGINQLPFLHFYYHKNSKIVFRYTLFSLIVLITLNLLLIPSYQLWGAVAASLLARVLTFCLLVGKHKELFFYLRHPKLYSIISISIGSILISYYLIQKKWLSYDLGGHLQFSIIFVSLLLIHKGRLKNSLRIRFQKKS